MAKYRAIPQGFMTVGEVAKKMGVTVRTLQYYDKEGLLSPSAESEGGRRLYTDKDLITLHQIISLKSLGFSLDDIKQRLISLETPADVANALTAQADNIRQKIEQLQASLSAIEQLKAEVLQFLHRHHQGNGGSYLHRYPLIFSFLKECYVLSLSFIKRITPKKLPPIQNIICKNFCKRLVARTSPCHCVSICRFLS